jgi:response regulator of citrate/malate metabolism
MTYRVLMVEDEDIAAEAHALYVGRLPDFEMAGVARTAQAAVQFLQHDAAVDVILLDMHLPDGHGLGVLRHLRAAGHSCDVIAVTSARDLDVVKHAVAQGVIAYLIKPFTFAGFRSKLEDYAAYRRQVAASDATLGQGDVDAMLAALRPTARGAELPKGLTLSTLALVSETLRRASGAGLTASDVANRIGASRVTARRYLEHLVESGLANRGSRYGGTGRPEVEFAWCGRPEARPDA